MESRRRRGAQAAGPNVSRRRRLGYLELRVCAGREVSERPAGGKSVPWTRGLNAPPAPPRCGLDTSALCECCTGGEGHIEKVDNPSSPFVVREAVHSFKRGNGAVQKG